jgi:hypothetical protein
MPAADGNFFYDGNRIQQHTRDGSPRQQWTCEDSNTMVWGLFDLDNPGGDQVINDRASKCLDVTDGSPQAGARLQIFHCTGTSNFAQHFIMR